MSTKDRSAAPEPITRGAAAPTARGAAIPIGRTVAIASLVLLALSYVVNAMDRQVFPVVLPSVNHEFGFDLGRAGWLSTIFTLGIGVAGIPTGFLLDRLSRKAVIMIGIGIYSAFTLLTAVSHGFADMFAYRALSGVGEAMQNASLFAAVGAFFFANRAMALGTLNFAYGVGGYLGPQLGALLAIHGWRTPFYLYGGIGVFMIILIALFIRESFTEREEATVVTAAHEYNHVPAGLLTRNIVLLAIAAAAVGLAMYGYIGLYPTFLQTKLGFTQLQAGTTASMFGLGALLGIPAGWIGDRVNLKWFLVVTLLAGCGVGFLIFNGPTGFAAQLVLSFAEGVVASGICFVNIYAAIQRAVRPELVGRASGIFVSLFYIPAAFAGILFSALVKQLGWGGAGIVQLGLIPIIAIIAVLFIRLDQQSNARKAAAA
ncbi:MFS transporter [Raineyella sp. LH-20]|uniref:MFS transporter n=1 Tax=Raineyella sp. LH-20 TaxID=3081204 RepID=UPI002954ADD2|nr:MFS transporter [Raineyella sp. LH-20]WOP19537.1 MFS transporter [Raineyella sp. LH-20]